MQQELQTGVENNQKLTKRPVRVPSSVSNALLPSVSSTLKEGSTAPVERRFDIAADKLPAKTFFMSLVSGTNYNIVIDPGVTGEISLDLKNVTLEETLDAVRDTYGFDYRRTSYGFEILPPALQTKMFTVNYLDVKRTGKSTTQISTGQISEQTTGTTNTSPVTGQSSQTTETQVPNAGEVSTRIEADFWKSLTETLKLMVGVDGGRSVVVNAQGGVVIVRAYPNELRQVTRYLDRLQANSNRQVILEAKILEVQLNDQYQAGIDWNAFGNVPAGNGGIGQVGLQAQSIVGTDLTDFDGIFTLSAFGDFGVMIQLLQSQGNVQVLSSPRISTVNNQKAVIKVGQDEYFVTGLSSTSGSTSTNGNTNPTQDVNLAPFFSGITLDVTPQISSDGNIILHIHPAVSLVKDQQKNIVLGTSVTGTTNNTFTLPLALSTIRESDNIVRAKNKQVVVIGGLMSNTMTEEVASVPFMGNLPVVGQFFRRTEQVARKMELVILLRPIITDVKVNTEDMVDSAERLRMMRRGFHAGSLPQIFGNEAEKTDKW
jgi:MSHA biogenesis protein MshL